MIKSQGRAAVAVSQPQPAAPEAVLTEISTQDSMPLVEDRDLELKLCIGAIPVMLLLGLAFNLSGLGHFFQRTFLGMPIHELGHATASWLSGFVSIPTLWVTHTFSRSFVVPLLVLGALGYAGYRAWLAGKRVLIVPLGIVVLVQAYCTLRLKENAARAFIVFSGDGLGMVLATALMATFFFGKRTQLYKGWLRWGFLLIGAGAFVDMFMTWWAARSDFGKVPFGEMEGAGLSDPTKLVDDYGWTTDQVIHRYVVLGLCCLAALAAVYAWGVWRAWRYAREKK